MTKLHSYSKLPTLRRLLRTRHEALSLEAGNETVFMLPSLANEDFLLDALAGDGSYFGSRPEIWSWAALYRAVVPPRAIRRQVDPPDHRLILQLILKQTLEELDGKEISVPKGVRRSGFVDLLSSSIRELLLEDVSPDRLLTTAAPEGKTIEPRELLYRLYSDYLLYLEANGLADNAQLPILTRLACAGDCGKLSGRPMFWVGFLSFTGAQLKLIRLLERRGIRLEFFTPDAGLAGFYDAASQLGLEREDAGDCGGRIVTLLSRDAYGQYEGIARGIALARGKEGISGEASCMGDFPDAAADVGILADSSGHPLIASALAKYGIPCESCAERPVSETLLVRTARQVWEAYLLDWPARRTLHLLSQPFFGLSFDRDRLALRMPEGWRVWRKLANEIPGAGELLDRLKRFCEYVNEPGGHTGEELLRALLELAGDDEWEARLSREAAEDIDLDYAVREVSSSRLEVRQKLELLSELRSAIGEAGNVRFSGGDAMSFLVSWSREAVTALPQARKGVVKLYDSPPPVMASHGIWIMTDVTPSRYSGASSEGSLLGTEVRESVNEIPAGENEDEIPVHLPTLREKREQKEALFRRLLAVGDEVTVLARPANDSQGRPQGESPFLTSLLSDRASNWSRLGEILHESDLGVLGEEGVSPLNRGIFPRTGLLFKNEDDEKKHVRLSAIDTWRACPFLFWCELMKIEPPREAASAVEALERGVLLHELWQRVWEKWEPGEKRPIAVRAMEEWDALLKEKAREGSAIGDPKASGVAAALSRMIRSVAGRMDEIEDSAIGSGLSREGVRVEYALPDFEGQNAVFVGRADRVDLWNGAGAVLLDYKLGKSDRYKDSLQLAAYAYLMKEAGEGLVEGFGFVGHKDARARGCWSDMMLPVYKGGKRGARDMSPDIGIAEAEKAIAGLDENIGAGRFPANYDSKNCPSCPYDIVCRRAERRGSAQEEESDESGESEE